MLRRFSSTGWAFVLAFLANGLLLWHFHDHYWWPPDEGSYAHVAERILDGEVLNRDVQDIHAGAINFLNAGALALFGRDMLAMRYPLMAAAWLQALLSFWLFRRRGPWVALVASLVGTAFGVVQFLDPTAHWYSLVLFWVIALYLAEADLGRPWRLEFLGALVGTQFCFRQLSGVITAVGVVAYLLLRLPDGSGAEPPSRPPRLARGLAVILMAGLGFYLWMATDANGLVLLGLWPLALLALSFRRLRLPDRAVLALAGRLLAGAVIAALPLVAYHLFHGSLASWLRDITVVAASVPHLEFMKVLSYASDFVAGGFAVLLEPRSLLDVASGLYWLTVPMAFLAAGLWTAWRLRRSPAIPDVLPFLAPFYGLVSVHLQNATYLYFAVGVSLLALLWLSREARPAVRWAVALYLASASIIALECQAGQSGRRSWDALLRGQTEPVVASESLLPRCRLKIEPYQLKVYHRMVELIQRETQPGEAIFALPSHSELYFLAERRNPFRFYNLLLGAKDPEEQQSVLSQLVAEPPKLLIFDRSDKYVTAFSDEVHARMGSGYEQIARIDDFWIYRRREPSQAPKN